MKNSETKFVYLQFNGLIGYKPQGKYNKIVYEESNPPWRNKNHNIGGVQCWNFGGFQ